MRTRIFKGATRPPLFLGVPLVAMVTLSLTTVVPLGICFIFQKYIVALVLAVVFSVAFTWLRITTKYDPWRSKQEMLRFNMRFDKGNTGIWGGVSYAPYKMKRMRLVSVSLTAAILSAITPSAHSFLGFNETQSQSIAATGTIEVAFSPNQGAEALVVKVIGSAKKEIRLLAYSFTSAPVTQALLLAAKRGVDIKIVVDEKNNITQDSSGKAHAALAALSSAGIDVRTIDAYPIHHDKVIVIDRASVELGSFNYSSAAATRNSENVLVNWSNPDLASIYLAHFKRNYAQSTPFRSRY